MSGFPLTLPSLRDGSLPLPQGERDAITLSPCGRGRDPLRSNGRVRGLAQVTRSSSFLLGAGSVGARP
jgi:hypothetical protein